MATVWVIETHEGDGVGAGVMGVYASQEAARAALEAEPNMRVFITGPDVESEYSRLGIRDGTLAGEPIDERRYPHVWATAVPMEVRE